DRSCVLRVEGARGSVLLTGDIERVSEEQILDRSGSRLQADVLIVPHHGSATSSTEAFLDAVSPRLAIFTLGYRNRFNHPSAEVYARYAALGVPLYRTDADGAVLLRMEATFRAEPWRRTRPRY